MSTENQQVTPAQALGVLNIATNPANAGKLSRTDYANVEIALQVLDLFVSQHTPKEKKPETPGAFGKSKTAPKP